MIKVYDLSTDKTTLYSTINSRAEGSCHNLQQEKILFRLQAGFPDSKNPNHLIHDNKMRHRKVILSGFVKLESDKRKPSCVKNNNNKRSVKLFNATSLTNLLV